MPKETIIFLKKYWLAIMIFFSTQFGIVFFDYIAAYKLKEYKFQQLESKTTEFIRKFEEETKPKLSILFWMHNLDIRDELKNNHEHKN